VWTDGREEAATGYWQTGYVGRQRERELLAALIGAALAGRGQAVLLAGEPGIGKTRLGEETAAMAAATGMSCLWGRATDEEGSPLYWPFRQVLRGLDSATLVRAAAEVALVAPEVGAGPGGAPGDRRPAAGDGSGAGGELRFQAFEAVTSVLTAAAEPGGLLVVLDDLQWADPASLRLLVHLSRGLADARLLVLATYRDTETGGRDALRQTLAALAREAAVTRLRLRGLTEREVAS